MADLTITAGSVKIKGSSKAVRVSFGDTITEGKTVYLDSATNKVKLADANDTAPKASVYGIAITPGVDGDVGYILRSGQIDVGATLTVGQVYVQSTTAGGIAPYADLASTNYVTILGVASAAGTLELDIQATGVQKA